MRGCCRDRQRTPATRSDPVEQFCRRDMVDRVSAWRGPDLTIKSVVGADAGCFGG